MDTKLKIKGKEKYSWKNFAKEFALCGLIGWCSECFWTGLYAIREHKDRKLTCRTSVWMFPIYGMAAVLRPLSQILRKANTLVRGLVYTACIFGTEYVTGRLLQKHQACPWDYSKARFNIRGVIRLDYAPVWFALGLIYERILKK